MTDRLELVRLNNPEFAEALARGEPWAVKYADSVRGIDGKSHRRHPERAHHEDGNPRNWCGVCPHAEGCMMCDLDEPTGETYRAMKGQIGKMRD